MESNIQYNLPEIAELYVQDKAGIISLMVEKYGIPMDPATVTHAELISQLKKLYEENENFRDDLIDLMQDHEIISEYNNQVDPVSAIAMAAGELFGMAGSFGNIKAAQVAAGAQGDKMFMELILAKQGQSNAGKIILISGISLAAIGLTAWLILRKKK